ncbi:MBL fold metallo-hydrolase [Paenibacillus sp. 481]|uniref:MBL fold metallo-hydrolase n=1 Tax=Paenibacillus sp. 481 TaxID=2835869 RepID=UPI001E4506C0|nr:MBL fold metallo-hydrolase [Paenibacillus sp. 481]UHA74402.1 MBL fold metallo-hydrolase [Paenibacillus sp. 481]
MSDHIEQQEAMPPITTWDSENGAIVQVRIPLPFSLRWVNAYLLQGEEGWTIVDPGLRTPQAEVAWEAVLGHFGIEAANAYHIVLTHYHPDHLGMAGLLQQQLDVPVLLSETGWRHAQMLWGEEQSMTERMVSFMRLHGVPAAEQEQLREHMDSFIPLVSPLPDVTYFTDGQVLTFGGRTWRAIETAGHAPGHMSLFDEQHGTLLAGDHVLPQISPNVSLLPNSDPAPLHSFLQGLHQLLALDIRLALPGHRHPFTHVRARIEELVRHHEERLDELEQLLATPRTGYELCAQLFGTVGKLSVHQFRFAMGEAIAHVAELERRGRAVRIEEVGAEHETPSLSWRAAVQV